MKYVDKLGSSGTTNAISSHDDTYRGYGYVVFESTPNAIIGKVFTLLEAVGLPDKQEESLKSLIRQIVWDEVDKGIWITPERHTAIHKDYLKADKQSRDNQTPGPGPV